MAQAGIFLDRDGTLIEEAHFLRVPEQVRLIPGAAPAVRALNQADFLVVVVTNQSGVARGLFDESAVHAVHRHLAELLTAEGASVQGFYYCPHHPAEGVGAYQVDCGCRKPKPGMLLRAAADFDLDLSRSWMIGDKVDDLEAGAAAGCRTMLVRTGHGQEVAGQLDATRLRLIGIYPALPEAVEVILSRFSQDAKEAG